MTPHEKLRALIDKVSKQQKRLPTGKGKRTMDEAANTSAIAKGQAIDRGKKTKAAKTMSLKELQMKR